jgi:iron complex outermembrane receptor protein
MRYASQLLRAASRGALLAAASLVWAAPALAASDAALAADAAAAEDSASDADLDGLQTITVTAQKREENLQATPIAISVVTSEDLVNRQVRSLVDLGDGSIPSLRIAPFFSRPGALIVNIRGVGVLSDANQPARDQGVGVYIDGVYLGRPQGLGAALFDVASIEVLKGPQGTLFGRNTEGGAVNIITHKPSGEFKLNATAGVGNYGGYKGEIHLDLPEIANISLKLDGVVTGRDGFIKNPLADQEDFNSFSKRGLAVTALWKPSPEFSATLGFDIGHDATSTLYLQQISRGTGLPVSASGSAAVLANTTSALFQLQPERADTAIFGVLQQPSVGETIGGRLDMQWEPSSTFRIRSITSYREMDQDQLDNANAAPGVQQATVSAGVVPSFLNFPFARYSQALFTQDQLSQELQFIGELPRLKYQVGALYYKENVEDNARAYNTLQFTDAVGSTFRACDITLTSAVASCRTIIQRASRVKTTSVGVYGQATYTPAIAGDIVHITAGARWTRDKKVGELFTINGALPTIPISGVNVTGVIPLNTSWSRVDPMVNISLDVSRDIHVYGKWSSGYKSGGASSRSLNYRAFDPETISMFEVGVKSEFWDNKARLNIAAYIGDYKGIQLDFAGLYEDIVNGVRVATTRTTLDVVNAPGTGKVKGVEAELTLAPFSGLTLSASYAYNSVKIPDTVNPFPQTGNVFITVPIPIYQTYTPEHSASAAIDYETPIGGVVLKAHFDINYNSGYFATNTDSNYDNVTRAVRFAQPKGDAGTIANARLAISDIELGNSGAKLTVAAWARNLFNEEHLFYKSGSAAAGISGFFNDHRTYGIELNVKM